MRWSGTSEVNMGCAFTTEVWRSVAAVAIRIVKSLPLQNKGGTSPTGFALMY